MRKRLLVLIFILVLALCLLIFPNLLFVIDFAKKADITGLPILDVSSNLVLYLPFDNDMKDYSGSGNDGSCSVCPTLLPAGGKVGGAYEFDSNSYIKVIPSPLRQQEPAGFSVSLWFKRTALTGT